MEGLKLGGMERQEEGETGGGERGREEGGKDLYFGISMFLLSMSEFMPQLKRDFGRLMASSSSSSCCLLGERRSVKEVDMNCDGEKMWWLELFAEVFRLPLEEAIFCLVCFGRWNEKNGNVKEQKVLDCVVIIYICII